MTNLVTQENAQATGDIVGRDKISHHEAPKRMIEKLLLRLKEQLDGDEKTQITIDELARYHSSDLSPWISSRYW